MYSDKELGDYHIDTKNIPDQVVKTLAERLVSPTFFEVPGWKRIIFFQKTFEIFGFDKDSVSLRYEEVVHPISVCNAHLFNLVDQTRKERYTKTFLVNRENFLI